MTVPGAVDGWFELHGKFGKLPMKRTAAPAIRYARDGFPVTEVIADYWAASAAAAEAKCPDFAEHVHCPTARAPRKGEMFRNPHLASTLRADRRRAAATRSTRARSRAASTRTCEANGGFLRTTTSPRTSSEWVEPVSTNYRGYDVWELPPNGQGIAALQMLNMLEGYDLKAMGFGSRRTTCTCSSRPRSSPSPTARVLRRPGVREDRRSTELISKDYADEARAS